MQIRRFSTPPFHPSPDDASYSSIQMDNPSAFRPVILFDGVCNLCHAAVNWVLDHDHQRVFRFASLQSQAAREALAASGSSPESLPDSVVLIDEQGVHTRSRAAIRIAARLGFPYTLLRGFALLPASLGDAVYAFIARHRYRYFGRRETCKVPSPEWSDRFLDADERITVAPAPALAESASCSWALFYFLVYCYASYLGPTTWSPLVQWLGRSLFRVDASVLPGGSGDTTYNYVELPLLAALATALWLALRLSPRPLLRDLGRTAIRYFLATTMLSYGWAKLVPVQFVPPGPDRLLATYGDSSPMGLLWTFMGASAPYQIFSGVGEVFAGALLLFRRTQLAGALLTAFVMLQVVALNFCYDVPVKLFASHLFAMALYLLAPYGTAILSFLVLHLPAAPPAVAPLQLPGRWWPRCRWLLKSVLVGYFFFYGAYDSWTYYQERAVQEAHPLHGLYAIENFRGEGLPAWRRAGLNLQGSIAIQDASGAATRFRLVVDFSKRSLELTPRDPSAATKLSYRELGPGLLLVEGSFQGVPVSAQWRKLPPSAALLTSRGFHWINESPFNR